MNGHHLAQLNIARPVAPPGSAQLADFMAGLDLVNGIAARSPGFVWRLKDESGNATSLHGFDDPALIINMSVWESPGHLEQFVWQTVHKRANGLRRPQGRISSCGGLLPAPCRRCNRLAKNLPIFKLMAQASMLLAGKACPISNFG